MFNETVYRPDDLALDGVASDAINALKNTPSQQNAGSSVWRDILGIGLSTGGAIVQALGNRNQQPQATLPYAPAGVPVSYQQQTELEAAREELARLQSEGATADSTASFSWTKDGLRLGGGATISPTMLLLGAAGLYLLFKEPPRRGR